MQLGHRMIYGKQVKDYKMDTREYIEVEDSLFVPFKWLDDDPTGNNLGRAEFKVCLKMKRGKLTEFWVTPHQQRRDEVWHCRANEYNDFNVSSYDGLQGVGAWLFYPCKEHKVLSFVVFVPTNSRYLEITPSGLGFWKNDYGDKPFTKVAEMLSKISVTMNVEEDKSLREKLISLDNKND